MKSREKYLLVAMIILFAFSLANAQTYTVLYTLGSHTSDPLNPAAIGLISQGRDGNLYTTAQVGGSHNSGSAFMFTPAGALTRLFDFSPYSAPTAPWSGLTLATNGNFYGTTTSGGITYASGTVFMVTPTGTVTFPHSFTAGTDDGNPQAAPVLGLDGNLYGTATVIYAGTYGVAYKLTSAGKFSVIHTFDYTHGATPYQLILGLDGNFYGVTRGGGTSGLGVVYRMSKGGVVKVLHNFTGYPNDGNLPVGTLAQASNGTLYGTTYLGGTKNIGTIFKISPTGTGYAVLHNFDRSVDITEGANPLAGLTLGTDGNLYGAAGAGGSKNAGALFEITPAGSYSSLYNFCAVSCLNGFGPQVSLVQHTNGKFYGDASGNSLNPGVIFSLDMGLGPFVKLVLFSGKVGQSIQILGQGFTGTSSVKLGGTDASFSVVSDSYLTATVPAGISGLVSVTTPGGTLTSNQKYVVVPTVSGFTPASGAVGSAVVITGTGLIQASKVTFGSKVATFVVNSDHQVTATVPTGAVTSKISVTTPGGKASSAKTFTVI
jgi:uncharacterized repeat protein (TIGR03803 family)